MTNAKPLVAILNTSEDVIGLLHSLLEDEGFATIGEFIIDFREGRKDIATFLRAHQPNVVVYDIAIPYDLNWYFFQEQVLGLHLLPPSAFVITTTNKAVLNALVGPTNAIELVGKPFDLDEIAQAVRHAITRSDRASLNERS